MSTIGTILSVILGVAFLGAGGTKVANIGPHEVEFPRYRLPAVEAQTARVLVGLTELVAALLLLIAAIASSTGLAIVGAIIVDPHNDRRVRHPHPHRRSTTPRWRPRPCSAFSASCCSSWPNVSPESSNQPTVCVHNRENGSGESPARSRRSVLVLLLRFRESTAAADDRSQLCCLVAARRRGAIMGA